MSPNAADANRIVCNQLLHLALESPVGIAVKSGDVEHLRRSLTLSRDWLRKQGTTAYDCLVFRTSPNELTELWIIKESKIGKAQERESSDGEAVRSESTGERVFSLKELLP